MLGVTYHRYIAELVYTKKIVQYDDNVYCAYKYAGKGRYVYGTGSDKHITQLVAHRSDFLCITKYIFVCMLTD